MLGAKNPVETLLDEHTKILDTLTDFEVVLKNDLSFWNDRRNLFDEFVVFFSLFADKLHHEKEENILFPLMEKKGFSPYEGPTQVMREEHVYARELLAHMREILSLPEDSSAESAGTKIEAWEEYKKSASAYIELMRQHIEKENHCLFPMALSAFDADDLEFLGKEFLKVQESEKFNELKKLSVSIVGDYQGR